MLCGICVSSDIESTVFGVNKGKEFAIQICEPIAVGMLGKYFIPR